MKLKLALIILLFFGVKSYAQTIDTSYDKNFVGGQLGGQLNIGAFYERSFIRKKKI